MNAGGQRCLEPPRRWCQMQRRCPRWRNGSHPSGVARVPVGWVIVSRASRCWGEKRVRCYAIVRSCATDGMRRGSAGGSIVSSIVNENSRCGDGLRVSYASIDKTCTICGVLRRSVGGALRSWGSFVVNGGEVKQRFPWILRRISHRPVSAYIELSPMAG